MVQAKHQQKSKAKKQPQMKKQGKQADISEFRAQLDALGLKIIQVTADGNCFFRALADQLEGNEEGHEKYRSMVVRYILENREMFAPFIEDDVPFDDYCQSMEKDGTWAGHMELQAASLVTRSNICIHRHMSPRWYIQNFNASGDRMIHLSYHDGEHYNSVRLKEDPCDGPARPIIIKADTDLSAASHQAKGASSKSKGGAGRNIIDAGSIKLVMVGSGCENEEKVEQVLVELSGDVDAAIEYLIAERETEEDLVENDKLLCQTDTCYGGNDSGKVEQGKEKLENNSCKQDSSSNSIGQVHDDSSCRRDEKKIPRNQACPCGSKKKCKTCCGSVAGRPSTKFLVQLTLVRVGRKGSKGRKVDLLNLFPPLDLVKGHPTWVRFVFDQDTKVFILLSPKEKQILDQIKGLLNAGVGALANVYIPKGEGIHLLSTAENFNHSRNQSQIMANALPSKFNFISESNDVTWTWLVDNVCALEV